MKFLFKEWQELWVPQLKERDVGMKILPGQVRKIITFTGIRRSGKTYLMFQLINKLSKNVSKDEIFYINI